MSSRPKHCKRCGKPATTARTISRAGNCPPCAVRAVKAQIKVNAAGGVKVDPVMAARWVAGVNRAAALALEGADDDEAGDAVAPS